MKNLTIHDREFIIECLAKGTPIPDDFQEKLFPTIQKEYELRYAGKMRKEDLLADQDGTFAVPLQVEKIYNGEREKYKDGWRNMIVFGDNLQFLKTCFANKDELIKNKVKGKVKLIYIDPPFATESDFKSRTGQKAYGDKAKDADFIEFLRRRLIVAREILSDDGNIIVHLDNKKIHYAKIVLDEVFGESNYINEIVWHKGREGGSSRSHSPSSSMPTEYQNILIYSKNRKDRFWNPILGPYKESTVKNILKDDVGWYYTRGRMGRTPAAWEVESGAGLKSYVLKDPKKSKDEVIKMITTLGAEFVTIGDVWNNEMIKFSQITDYPTEKPEGLLKLFIKAATNENDIVLDFFGGSGTTAAVAEKLNRRWITCDIGKFSIYTIQKRLLSIQDSKEISNSKKNYHKQARTFVTVNTGIYDLKKMQELNQDKYIEFVMSLFEVTPQPKTIKGIKLHGERKDGYSVLVWDYWNHKDSSVDIFFLEQLHQNIGKRISKRLYIIAPANAVQFISDFHEIDDVRYYFLKIPYQIIRELHPKSFAKFRQPQSKNKVNDLDNAIGFHFMLQPEVESIFKDGKLIIKKFLSNFREEESDKQLPNFESLSMVIIDEKFNGKDFLMSQCLFKEDIESKNGTLQISIPNTGKEICVIYIDLYGNEFKETIKKK